MIKSYWLAVYGSAASIPAHPGVSDDFLAGSPYTYWYNILNTICCDMHLFIYLYICKSYTQLL